MMSHKPPIPEAQTARWPAHPAPREDAPVAEPESPEQPGWGSRVDKRVVAGVAGMVVGSAAVAAALLFAGRSSKPKTASTDPAQPGTNVANAGEIGVD
jgi:hypothetical protein